ncbi:MULTISPECIES: hypothetical protein [Cellulophaga]|uniref:Uncharacterized protein n=2 Tax=Cellulophaga TaxID=104264 RepID=F0REG3_CELLC|nr:MULTISPECIES: hypothetical protein [Cellulophaga]ADY29938.1 hypothetical protein Celly_2117 [Cellulophaga lytica DSM 7489]EWH15013.1 hypothetical protein KLA_00600 [Cellulophaga geojensis KL-A]MDO6853424.1 hypothetical protein [Cellulophaga lytica]WQG75898.1 hypothetical protein SR888_09370 [Cellulophaga lytica]SNQ42115.1 conserved exported hypothetical protein [Cellulophaga lytica]
MQKPTTQTQKVNTIAYGILISTFALALLFGLGYNFGKLLYYLGF